MKLQKIKKIFALIFIVTLITIFFACKKTDLNSGNPVINGSVAGRVTDLNNVPINNASVTAGTITTTTDVDGHFIIKNVQLSKDAGFAQVTKPGFFTGSRTFSVNTNTVNNVKIQLIPKTVSGNFDAASGGDVNITGGGLVNFGANDVVIASNGTAYTGNVSVSTFYLNPADANFNEYMPGNLLGLNSNNQQQILQSFGMLLVEMNDATGEKLQIATGKTAAITIPIPSAMQANAPATIPLWYFDETKGIWKQEGSATKQGNNYVGTVAHFSFWTAGQLGQSVRLDAAFKDQDGKVLANNLVTLTSTNYGTSSGYTDSAGTVSGLIPANETLVMKVVDQCNSVIYMQNIGPFSADTNLGNISVPVTGNCTASTQYINLTLNGVDYSWVDPDPISGIHVDTSGGTSNSTHVQGGSGGKWINFYIFNDNAMPGDYRINLSTNINGKSYPNNSDTTTITEYGLPGGFIIGTAFGELKELDSTTNFTFSCNYKVKRIQ